ncbi:BcsA naringenin-chalcone synthase [Pyrenophora tritici-repentis]|uniref:BcsA, naringenin-chalcone synthase n=1 Tax=Pyrenophora tritici-repentis TaxID=45151 RepID=A0A2W1FIY5_9PLEO|nr:Polyketide synthase PksE [Pyrenophora tritici-repentis]KAF7446825.1 Polyketide synthase PksE [Pyrenophora tritici-repentis]KAF7569100.1 BcsA, naringenin-chalcone synthase [Pyrenophora tritici-repentis]KAG9383099.1 Polyketide synthase PksE [Pyrenophora tritici-repentis]KAI0588613.1 Polyketide synthase PksE [Pyrenophora tritici-repentis]
MVHNGKPEGVYITGLAHEYPQFSVKQDQFQGLLEKLYPGHSNVKGLQKLVALNNKTNILSRPTVHDYTQWTKEDTEPPTIDSISRVFRAVSGDIATSACNKAIKEAGLAPNDITHVVAVTCTDQGNPGYDLFVCQKLGLRPEVQRVLLQGVGCAGGLSALRTAAGIVAASSQKHRPARVLVMTCELCSLFLRAELQAAIRDGDSLHVAPALFSDAAAALVVCNGDALGEAQKPIFELEEYGSMAVPGTSGYMSYDIEKNGMIARITKDVPKAAVSAIIPMFKQLQSASSSSHGHGFPAHYSPLSTFDWAIHPGGAAILEGAKQALQLTDDHIKASLDVYRNYGNSSSSTVLIVLDKLRNMGKGRDKVVATSFGPGLSIEMCILKRSRHSLGSVFTMVQRHSKICAVWLSLISKLSRGVSRREPAVKKMDE